MEQPRKGRNRVARHPATDVHRHALRGGVAPLGWVTEDRILCGLKSGKGALPAPFKLCYHVYTKGRDYMQTQKVGIREFRERLATFLEASGPVAITRHGETVGYYIPARPSKDAAHVAALRTAAEQLDALLAASGATEDELVNDFKEARRRRRKVRT